MLAALFVRRISSAIVNPVTALSDVARVVGEGNLDVSVTASRTVRELVQPLAEALREMVAKLRVYRDSSLGELLAAKDLANATVACSARSRGGAHLRRREISADERRRRG